MRGSSHLVAVQMQTDAGGRVGSSQGARRGIQACIKVKRHADALQASYFASGLPIHQPSVAYSRAAVHPCLPAVRATGSTRRRWKAGWQRTPPQHLAGRGWALRCRTMLAPAMRQPRRRRLQRRPARAAAARRICLLPGRR